MDILENLQQTENYFLEPITVRHARLLFESLQPARLYTYVPADPPVSLEALESKYKKWARRLSADGNEIWLNYAILDKKDNTYKGTLQATVIKNAETYIAYEVFPDHWRTGIAKVCVQELINVLFKEFNCNKISALTDTRNIPSHKLLESLNFEKTRTIIDADFFKGRSSDEFEYELEKRNWLE